MLANDILDQLAAAGGPDVARFTDAELLRNAGIVPATPDTTPPTVTWTSPATGAQLAGTVTLRATAADNVGVVGVRFKRARLTVTH
jgi:hypothetical protein